MNDDFYVGYLPEAPRSVARFLRLVVAGVILVAAAIGLLLATTQQPADEGVFEFGTVRDWTGTLAADPYPRLVETTATGERSSRLLVGLGKHGADDAVAGVIVDVAGQLVDVHGTRIAGAGVEMIELASTPETSTPETAPETPHAPPLAPGSPAQRGTITVRGEIVDSKCYLGAMKPGRGKPHRACAVRCISGGVPPALLVETTNGDRRVLLLVDASRRPLGEPLLDYVGVPLEVSGALSEHDGLFYLSTSLDQLQRLSR